MDETKDNFLKRYDITMKKTVYSYWFVLCSDPVSFIHSPDKYLLGIK